ARALARDRIPERDGWVVEVLGRDPRPADLIGALGKLVVSDLSRKLAELDGEVGELHLAREGLLERAAASLGRPDGKDVTRHEDRFEERESLNVIPMGVAQENTPLDRLGRGGQELVP